MFLKPSLNIPISSMLLIVGLLAACKTANFNPFKPASLHEQYQKKLTSAGLDKTAMGADWINAASQSIQTPVDITLPFRETGYFAIEKVRAVSYRISAVRGQRLTIQLLKKPSVQFAVYMDVWELQDRREPKLLASQDSLGNSIQFDADDDTKYLVRLQPELLKSGEYTLEINTGPSLAFPVKKSDRKQIGSFWGDGRDGNSRKHEGIDIFAPFRTPALASANGTIVRVNENNLGGKVVWLRPENKNITLYYAHLDLQIATEGQQIKIGDTVGLIGNTGNARTTPSHLHFGIYTSGGAINPLPFIDGNQAPLPSISVAINRLNSTLRTSRTTAVYRAASTTSAKLSTLKKNTIVTVYGAQKDWYRVELPDRNSGFIKGDQLNAASSIKNLKMQSAQQLYERPDSLAPVKRYFSAGDQVALLGEFGKYQLVLDKDQQSGWIKTSPGR